jgi:hypothetical protein
VTVSDYTRNERFPGATLVVDQLGDPGEDMTVLAGDVDGATMIDVDVLRRVFSGDEPRIAERA